MSCVIVDYLFYPSLFALGLVVGSFLNVCIWRVPREESIVFPPSHCTRCNNPIHFYDNIPVLSFIFLKGHCRGCGEKISWQYPLVEMITALSFLLLGRKFGPSWQLIPYLMFAGLLIVISFIDITHYIIPDIISLPGIAAGFLISLLPFMHVTWKESLAGIGICIGGFYFISVISMWIWKREGLGMGDVKLIGMIAAFLGWKGGLVTIFWGSLLGSIWGLQLIILRKKGRMDIIPFGPFLCLGALITLLYGQELIRWYQGLFVP